MADSIVIEGLGKRYLLGEAADPYATLQEAIRSVARGAGREAPQELWALQDIDLTVAEGEAIGVVGRNGAGKSTLLKVLARITEPTVGRARVRGRVGVLLEVGTGFHQELTGRENIFLNGVVLGMSRRDVRSRFDDIVEFAGVEEFLDTPLKRYSSGMYLRLAFAVAAHLEPDIMIVDEVLAVGDFEFQRRCLGKVSELQHEGRTVLFVSHDLAAVSQICTRGVWLDRGRVAREGDVDHVLEAYLSSGAPGTPTVANFTDDGSGPVRLLRAALVDPDDAEIGEPRRNEDFGIEVRFALERAVHSLDVELWLVNRRGIPVLDESWEDRRAAVGYCTEPGVYRTVLRIPPVLSAGDYTVFVWIGSHWEQHVQREILRFTLHPLPEDINAYEQTRPGRVFHPAVSWSIEREAAA